MKNVFKIFVKCLLIVCLFFASFCFLNKVFYNKEIDRGLSYHNLPENCIDVLVLGSSHAQYSFAPSIFYEDTGLYSYVLGSACQPLEVSVEMLKEALKTQNPRLVILEVYTSLPLRFEHCYSDSCYVIAEYQMRGEEKYNTISYLPEEKAESYNNDFFVYHNDWKIMNEILIKNDKADVDPYFGYVYQDQILPIYNYWTTNIYDTIPGEIDENDLNSLNKILRICKENDIELLLYKTPIDSVGENDYQTLLAVWNWANENGVSYFDAYSKASDIGYWMMVHSDSTHAFVHGATYLTDLLAKEVSKSDIKFSHKENYLTDIYKLNEQHLTIKSLSLEKDQYKNFLRIENTSSYIILRYVVSNEYPPNEMTEILIKKGFTDFDVKSNYFGIAKDGKLIASSNGHIDTSLLGHHVFIDINEISIDENKLSSNKFMSIGLINEDGSDFCMEDIEYRWIIWNGSTHNYYYDYLNNN